MKTCFVVLFVSACAFLAAQDAKVPAWVQGKAGNAAIFTPGAGAAGSEYFVRIGGPVGAVVEYFFDVSTEQGRLSKTAPLRVRIGSHGYADVKLGMKAGQPADAMANFKWKVLSSPRYPADINFRILAN